MKEKFAPRVYALPRMQHFADRLLKKIEAKGAPLCVGLDPVYAKLPAPIRNGPGGELGAIERFIRQMLPLLAEEVPCVKPQSACFERYGAPGVDLYRRITAEAQRLGLLVIGDAKRGDIGSTAEHYAHATLGEGSPDAVTVNTYFGAEGLTPFLDLAERNGKGVFALVRTSNPSGDAIQSLELKSGGTVAQAVARIVAGLGDAKKYVGERGYSLLGAVVGATKPGDAASLRALMPRQIFLVPGYGAQGGTADDVRACFLPDGTGAVVTASRSVTYAFHDLPDPDWLKSVVSEIRRIKQGLHRADIGPRDRP